MPFPSLIIFDMAGTTVRDNGEVERCFMDAAKATGLNAEGDRIVSMMGWSKRLVFQTLWAEQLGVDHPRLSEVVETSYSKFKYVLEHHYRTQPVEPTEGCLELFSWLTSKSIFIGLNTGFYRNVTTIILNRLGWDRGLDFHYIGNLQSTIQVSVTPSEIYGEEGRPAPYMIQKAMYCLGVRDPQQVMVVGDTPSDLAAGMNAHCGAVVGVTNGTHTRQQLEAHPHHALVDSLTDLHIHLTQLV